MTATPTVQGRCPACSRTTLILGVGGYVTCSHLECPDPSAASDLLDRQTVGTWPGDRCEITIDVIDQQSKRQIRRVAPLHADDMTATRSVLAMELRLVAEEIDTGRALWLRRTRKPATSPEAQR